MRKVLSLLAACAAMTGCAKAAPTASQAAFTSDNHTVLLMHFDGTLNDSGPWGLNSTNRGTTQWTDGRFGQAMKFDGKSVVVVPNFSALHIGDQSWTVEAWIKPDKLQRTLWIVGGGWGFGRMYDMEIDNGKYLKTFFNDGTNDPNVNYSVTSPDVSATLFDGNWHHVAAVLDRSRYGEIRLYLDGQQIKTAKLTFCGPIKLEGDSMGFTVGSLVPWDVSGGFSGLIDEVRISNMVRPEYVANYPIPADQMPPIIPAKVPFKYDQALSKIPLPLTPESTFIVPVSIAAEGNTANAAKLLQTYLRKIYGVDKGFDIVAQDKVTSLDGKAILALGDSKWADDAELASLPLYSYEIKRKANVVVIAGNNSLGTQAGVVHFLDEFCGVRFYMPGDLWTSVPVGKKIVLPRIYQIDKPFVVGTNMTGIENQNGISDWVTYNQIMRRVGGATQHNMFDMFPPSLYADKYPDVYPIINGVRHIPKDGQDQGWQPNFASPDTLEAAKDSVTRYFKAYPNDSYVAMGIMDSDGFDNSPASMELVKQYQQKYPDLYTAKIHAYSQTYWEFINKLGAWMLIHEPGKQLMGLSYGLVQGNPGFKLSSNILVITVWGIAELEADGRLKPDKNGVSELAGWLKIASHIGNHDWYFGNGYYMPRNYTGYWSTYLKALKAAGVKDSFQHIEAYPSWGMDGPKYYVLSRLMWDPSLDPNMLWKQFSDDMFGPAAPAMQKYFQEQEKLWVQLDDVEGPERKLFRWSTQFITNDTSMAMVKEARADMDQAIALAATPDQKARVQLFNKCFHLSEMMFDLASLKATPDDQLKTQSDAIRKYFQEEILPDPMTIHSGIRTLNYIDQAMRVVIAGRKLPAAQRGYGQ